MDNQRSCQHLQDKGYVLLEKVVQPQNIDHYRQQLHKTIHMCADDVGCSVEDYLSSVSRWGSPSPVTTCLLPLIRQKIEQSLRNTLGSEVLLDKYNVICKNAYSPSAIPYHQDISYSPHSPYEVTAWLALTDSDERSGPLEVLPGTHQNPLASAVDFWSPDYKPDITKGTKILCAKGDVILFDSRIWHGSSESQSLQDRYALVSRWSSLQYRPPEFIPDIKKEPFGMWTCGEVTKALLQTGAHLILDIKTSNFVDLLDCWINALTHINLPFFIVKSEAIHALKKIKILHLAHEKHNGGDGSGSLYKNLWHAFLKPLKTYTEPKLLEDTAYDNA